MSQTGQFVKTIYNKKMMPQQHHFFVVSGYRINSIYTEIHSWGEDNFFQSYCPVHR